jgi:diguanylate cyclase (GGDEF)-like protein
MHDLTWASWKSRQLAFLKYARWHVDQERLQAMLRLRGGVAVLLVAGLLHIWGGWGSFAPLLNLFFGYTLLSMGWYVVVRQRWWGLRARVLMAAAAEQMFYGYMLGVTGEQGALLAGLPMFTALGYGLRYGPGLAFYSGLHGVVWLWLGLQQSAFWHGQPTVSAGLMLASVVIPVYGALLSRRMQTRRLEAEQRAAVWEEVSKTDPLTMLANRVALMEALERVFHNQRQLGRVGALFYVDLDGFKAVNDEAGHEAGDQVLVDVALALRSAVREDDVVARLGGDEFAILAMGVAHEHDARAMADKVLHALEGIVVDGYPGLKLGGSIGVCLMPSADISTAREAVRRADEMMLSVKRMGKGAVRVSAVLPDMAQSA